MPCKYELSDEYRELAYAVIDAVPELWTIKQADIRVGFIKSFKEKHDGSNHVLGQCIKVPEIYVELLSLDFLIVIYEPNVVGLTTNQKKVLLWHELKHIGIRDTDGEPMYITVPHDREEFDSIINRVGMYWSELGADVPDIFTDNGGAVIPRE